MDHHDHHGIVDFASLTTPQLSMVELSAVLWVLKQKIAQPLVPTLSDIDHRSQGDDAGTTCPFVLNT